MTILQFQQLYFIGQSMDDDLDKSIKMVGVVTGLTPDRVDNKMPMKRFNRICAYILKHFAILDKKLVTGKPVSMVRANGRTYKLHYRIDKLPITAAKYVEVIEFSKDKITNLHKIMASIAQPVKWSWRKWEYVPYQRDHDNVATDMERVDFKAAYHAAVFFYTHYQVSMILIRPYLIKELMSKGVTREAAARTLTDLSTVLDGFTMPKWSLTLKEYLLNRYGTSELSVS